MHGMRKWHTPLERVGSMPLAADPRLTDIIPEKDYTWSITSQHVDPRALTLLTRFGLQVLSFQLFPEFIRGSELNRNPDSFSTPPHIHTFTTNTLTLTYAPWEGLDVLSRYWIPTSGAAAGEIEITNSSHMLQEIRFRQASILKFRGTGQQMHAQKHQNRTVLGGKSGDLHPVLFLSGGARADNAPFPCLSIELSLPPGKRKTLQWILTSENDLRTSFQAAMDLMDGNWQYNYAQSRALWQGEVQITTGDPDWDLGLALSRKVALGALSGKDNQGRYLFSNARLDVDRPLPDTEEVGSDRRTASLSPLQGYYLADTLSPLEPGLLDSLLACWLKDPTRESMGHHAPYHPAPFLAQIAGKHTPHGQEKEPLSTWFPALQAYLEEWFSPDQDRDQDGAPEWARQDQLDCSAHPAHYASPDWFQHPRIQTMESPAVCSLLINEIDHLLNISRALDMTDGIDTDDLEDKKRTLAGHIQRAWNDDQGAYLRWDRDVHTSPPCASLAAGQGPGLVIINQEMATPARIVIHLRSERPLPPTTTIFLHGKGVGQEHWVERISSPAIHWYQQDGSATSHRVYHFLEYVVVYGIEADVEIGVYSAGFQVQDLLLTLPLRTRAMTDKQARDMIYDKLMDSEQYAGKYGLQASLNPLRTDVLQAWNLLIGESMLWRGERRPAADLITRIMNAFLNNLGGHAMAYARHAAHNGKAKGGGYQITGTVPCGFFLNTLGVNILNNRTVIVEGVNPFPWPVTCSYRGLDITRAADTTEVTFPDGQTTLIEDQPHKRTRVTYS